MDQQSDADLAANVDAGMAALNAHLGYREVSRTRDANGIVTIQLERLPIIEEP
ncbi:hypothetical protein [Nocardia sp. NPDC019302]|uniref:hypothetical protein n=1 Tax=Nocardia sp. NPDC019302 TaxID=3154592 RepID=UPI0033E06ABA